MVRLEADSCQTVGGNKPINFGGEPGRDAMITDERAAKYVLELVQGGLPTYKTGSSEP